MKKIVFMLVAFITFSVSAQKKKNGTVYVDHPAIDMIDLFKTHGFLEILKKLVLSFTKILKFSMQLAKTRSKRDLLKHK